MKKNILFFLLFCSTGIFSQKINSIINVKETERIETILSSDDMQGRKVFTTGIENAAKFIAAEFTKSGLQPLKGSNGYLQEFNISETKNISEKIVIDGKIIPDSLVAVSSYKNQVHLTEKDSVEIIKINAGDDFRAKIWPCIQSNKNLLVLADASFAPFVNRLKTMSKMKAGKEENSVVIVFGKTDATNFTIDLTNDINKKKLFNVAGMIKGKSKPDEYVIFSAHYDHLGIGKAVNDDSVYNGANDDAAGTTAVIMLANYFKTLHNNDRTIIFVAFTAEETGGYGSQYFSRQLDPQKVMAMFNIEMIGTASKWGNNSAYITGYEKSDMGKILQQNLEGSSFNFYPDPYTEENLFYRSDNATLARLGVPAHTISTSKMDNEPNYHKPSDELKTLDLANMTEIIKAIAISSASIISGKDTPSRVDTAQLK